MARLRTSRLASLGALLLVCLMGSAFGQERFTRQVAFDIAAQSVEAALLEFSKQADVQVMVGTSSLNGQKTEGVKGTFSVKDALRELLKNTGLEYQTEGNSTVTIRSAVAAKTEARVLPLAGSARLADRDRVGAAGGAREASSNVREESSSPSIETLDEVIVTGTHIRGVTPGSPVLTFTALDVERTGFATAQDWIDTLPQNFGSTPNEEGGGIGNFNRGTGINLRGLGSGATLVLVDGRRQAASGLEGDFVDVSSIPASAIDHVEVLTDGASAVYGSDAIGGVVNFVLRKDFKGAETKLRYATASGGGDEVVASQLFGTSWSGGNAILSYQFYDRGNVLTGARSYASNADKTPRGGDDFRFTTSNPGNILFLGRPAFAIPAGQDGRSLTTSDLLPGVINRQNQLEGADLLPERQMHSAFLSLNQQIGDRFGLFVEGRYSTREMLARTQATGRALLVPASNPFDVNPTPLPFVFVAYSFFDDFGPPLATGETDTYQATIGGHWSITDQWLARLSASTGAESLDYTAPVIDFLALSRALADPNPATAFNPFGDGTNTNPDTLASIQTVQRERGKTRVDNANVTLDGPLFALAGGSAKLAFGADYRVEELQRGIATRLELDRDVTSGFFELVMPFVGTTNARSGLYRFELAAAGRYEQYSDFGNTFNPRIGLRYAPWSVVELHGSWGTSFRAPKIFDLENRSLPTNVVVETPIPDPQSPFGQSLALLRVGGNADLSEETADTWTAGVTITSPYKLTASLTYFDIAYKDRIGQPGPADPLAILLDEQMWSSVITRTPSRAEIDALCNDPNYIGSRTDCLLGTPDVIIDIRKQNIAKTNVRGLDFALEQPLQTSLGVFTFGLNASYVLDYEIAVSDTSTSVDVIDTINNPAALRLRANGSWARGGLDLNVAFNHTGSYQDDTQLQDRSVGAWNTVDLRIGYETAKNSGWLAGLTVAITATNVFDRDPPFVNRALGYDATNATPIGRFVGAQLTKSW